MLLNNWNFCKFYPTSVKLGCCVISCNMHVLHLAQYLSSSYLALQRAGLVGVAGLYAVRSAVVESRCAAEAANQRMAYAREQLKRGGPATLSPVLVSPPVI